MLPCDISVAYHNSMIGCHKCITIGAYNDKSKTVVFEHTACEERTNEGFRNRAYDCIAMDIYHRYMKYHKYASPLEDLPIDMVKQFIVADDLHLLHLGLMKRLLIGCMSGNLGYQTKWSASQMSEISHKLKEIRMPKEFNRSVRGLDEISHWKGAEYFMFLQYFSIIVFRKNLSLEYYHHFLCVFCAITICSSKAYHTWLDLAQFLFDTYIESFIVMYGVQYITSNIHNLTHVVSEVRQYGELSSFSSYPFESRLFQIKSNIRNGNLPLEQVARRSTEYMQIMSKLENKNVYDKYPKLSTPNCGGNLKNIFPNSVQYFYKIKCKKYNLNANKEEDKWILSKTNEIVAIQNILLLKNKICVLGESLTNVTDFFEIPMKSSILDIYCSDCKKRNSVKLYDLDSDFKCKLVSLQHDNLQVFVPIYDTMNI